MSEPFQAPSPAGAPLPDAPVSGHWVDLIAPRPLRPYLKLARIDRPIGWWLLLLPCWWSAGLAAIAAGRPFPDPWHLALFLIGAVAMRGAGSTFNDIVDRDLDAQVSRTRARPLPSGVVSPAQAAGFMLLQALIGFVVLIQFNRFTIWLGIASLGLVAIYPFMKRFMNMPQFVLGLAFAWGALVGWAAVFGRLDAPAVLAYLAAIVWTIAYDTIYALQDIEDDEVVGIRSSARWFGGNTRGAVAALYALATLAIGAAAHLSGAGLVGFLAIAAFAGHLAWQVSRIPGARPAEALMLFRSNRDAGLILAVGFAADAAFRVLA